MTDTPAKVAPDWERIESSYRAGLLSLREIAGQHGISHVAINKRAKRDGWTRNLEAKIKARADALVTKQAVTALVTTASLETERVLIESSAHAIANVRLGHRTDIGRARALCVTLLAELEAVTGERLTIEHLSEIVEKLDGLDEKMAQKAREALFKTTSLPTRASTIKALVEAMRGLVSMEREAWGLSADSKVPEPTEPVTGEAAEASYLRMITRQ